MPEGSSPCLCPPDLSNALAASDPYPAYHRLRESAPICSTGEGRWIVSRYHDVAALLHDPRCAHWGEDPGVEHALTATEAALARSVHALSPTYPLPFRQAVLRHLSARALDRHAARMRQHTDELLLHLRGKASFDVIADYAHPFTFATVCRVMGVPEEDVTALSDMVSGPGSHYLASVGAGHDGRYAEFTGYFYDLISAKRRRGGDDLISSLIAVAETACGREGKGHFDTAELVNLIVLLLYAGHENMMNFLGNAVRVLGQHPEARATLRHAPAKMGEAFLELLRFDSPVQHILLVAREAFVLHGQAINSGDLVMLCVGAANHDPTVYTKPDSFDLERAPKQQLAFGAGRHRCMGARLAQLEGSTALWGLLARLADFTLPPEPLQWRTGMLVQRGLYTLPVEGVRYAESSN